MKQTDFGMFFHSDTPKKIKYQVRFGANLLHDMTYLASYIHDSRFKIESINHIKKRLVIPLERDCWELDSEDEIKTAKSKLTFFPVEKFSFVISDIRIEKGLIKGHDDEDNIWISNMYLSDDYYTNEENFNVVLIDRSGFKLQVNITRANPLIKLEDLTIPAKWEERIKENENKK